MLRNALQRSTLVPSSSSSSAAAVRTICHFCSHRLPLSRRHLSTTLPAYKSRSPKRAPAPAPAPAAAADPTKDTEEKRAEAEILTEVRKDIKETVARKNEAKESRRWKQKAKSNVYPATEDAAAVASEGHVENRRRRREKVKVEKAIRKAAEKKASAAAGHEKGGEKGKSDKLPKNVSVRRVNGMVPVPTTTPKEKGKGKDKDKDKEMGGVSLAAALSRRPKSKNLLTMDPEGDNVKPIIMDNSKKPPAIKHDLDRVLFNPGVHYLQDPHSRVYNFDPYLRDIMPVTEFDFAAVDGYVTSSRDTKLAALAVSLGKKYVGSTSSMTSVLAHFHYLLSHWRNINIGALSKDFPAEYNTFTQLSRAPAAVFLRYKGNGTYAIDPDKEFDMDSILSLLGRSLEKMLTMAPDEYAALRLDAGAPPAASGPDTFHYSTLGDFLMRSQLDAYDPRLPGTGMYDLKTRAVVSVRMDVANFHLGSGYQIKTLRGQWESFEREYFDMIRAAFLKYSLQVRMGRMDGIFVAFHNTERIFGFQYVSLEEMDSSIHEGWGSGIGEREFVLSLMFLNEALNRATARFPEQSLRLHFETRETQAPQMYITAEPMAEADIDEIQNRNTRDLDEFLKSLELKRDSVHQKTELKEIAEKFGDVEEAEEAAEDAVEVDEGEMESGEKAADVESVEMDVLEEEEEEEVSTRVWESGAEGVQGIEVDISDKEVDLPAWESGQRGAEGVESAANVAMIDGASIDDPDAVQTAQDIDEDDDEAEDDKDNDDDDDDDDEDSDSDSDSDDDEEAEVLIPTKVDGIPDEHMEKPVPDNADADADLEVFPIPEVPGDTGADADADADLEVSPIAGVPELDRPLLAMTLTTYNKVNDKPVLRPGILRPEDKWTVDYTIAEAKTNERAWGTYNAIKTRRRKSVESNDQPADSEVSQYVKYLRTLSKSGRAWEVEQEALFGGERVIYEGKGKEREKGGGVGGGGGGGGGVGGESGESG